MTKFVVYYSHGKEINKMLISLKEDETENLREVFYDSCPEDSPKILAIKELS